MVQMKEQDQIPEKNRDETEAIYLIQSSQLQSQRCSPIWGKHSVNFNKETENARKNQAEVTELKNKITELKNTLEVQKQTR